MRRPSPSQPPQLSHSPSLCSSLSSHDVLQPDNSRSPSPRSPTPPQRSRIRSPPAIRGRGHGLGRRRVVNQSAATAQR